MAQDSNRLTNMTASEHEDWFVCKICSMGLSTRTSLSHFTKHHQIHNKLIQTHDRRFVETIDAHIDHIVDIWAITTPHDDSDLPHMLYTEVFSRKNKKKKCVTFKGVI
jgi:hypothetical protein